MIAQLQGLSQLFEAGMLVCFGISWPVAVLRTCRSRRTEGISMAFLLLIFAGYFSGMGAKFVAAMIAAPEGGFVQLVMALQPVTALYFLNAFFVGMQIMLVLKLRHDHMVRPAVRSMKLQGKLPIDMDPALMNSQISASAASKSS